MTCCDMFQTLLTESLKVKFDSEFVTYITYILASEPGGTLKTRCLFCCNWSSSLRMSTRRRLVMSEDEMSQMSQGAALPSLGFHGDLNVRQHVSLLKMFERSKWTSSRTLPYFANTIWFELYNFSPRYRQSDNLPKAEPVPTPNLWGSFGYRKAQSPTPA